MSKKKHGSISAESLSEQTENEEAPPKPNAADTPGSLVAAAFGLQPNGRLCKIVNGAFVLRAEGILNLARRTLVVPDQIRGGPPVMPYSAIQQIELRCVYDRDSFGLDYGKYLLSHAPSANADGEKGVLIGAYCVVAMPGGYRLIEFERARDLVAGIAEDSPIAIAAGSAEDLMRRLILVRALESVPYDLPDVWRALEAERQSISGEPVTAAE